MHGFRLSRENQNTSVNLCNVESQFETYDQYRPEYKRLPLKVLIKHILMYLSSTQHISIV